MSSTSSLQSNASSLQLGATSATIQQTTTQKMQQMDVSLTPTSITSASNIHHVSGGGGATTNLTPTLSRQPGSDDDDSGCALEDYAWVPPDLKPDQIRQYFESIPEEKRPYVNSVGEKYRHKQMLFQLPPHDNDASYCNEMSSEEKEALRLFSIQRKQDSLGRGKAVQIPLTNSEQITCRDCKKSVENGSIGIYASRAKAYWHPGCFNCSTCQELLVDLVYFYNKADERVYCGRHHAEKIKTRCSACDEIIFLDECTEAEGKSWHMHHFVCQECSEPLGGQRYYMREDMPWCCKCYEQVHIEYCATCGELIERGQAQVSFEDLHWHSSDKCFKCNTCAKSLIDNKGFIPKQGLIYCSNECAYYSKPSTTSLLKPPQPSVSSSAVLAAKGSLKPISQSPPTQLLSNLNASTTTAATRLKMDHNLLLSSPGLTDQDASQILQLQRQIHNQSRSRKPFNFAAMTDYEAEIASGRCVETSNGSASPPVNLPAMTLQQQQQHVVDQPDLLINRKLQLLRQQQQQQFQDSFDDLDSDAVINMSQFNVTKSNMVAPAHHHHQQLMNSGKSPMVQPKQPLKSNLKKNPAAGNQMPASILKRFDSSERMYPFSRPNGLASASASMLQQHSQQQQQLGQLCSASVNGGFDMGSLARGSGSRRAANYGDNVDYGYGMKLSKSFHSQPGSPVMQQAAPARKRVQFANIPPLNSSAGDLHLTGGNGNYSPSSSSGKSSRHRHGSSSHSHHHHHHSDHHGHHQSKHHKHHHHHGSGGKRSSSHHRRSSSTGNFNNMSMNAMPPNVLPPYTHHQYPHGKRQNVRPMSNRNHQIYSDSDYCCNPAVTGYATGYQGVDYGGEYDDYEDNDYFNNTCSTCSSSTLTSSSNTTTSTDSDSESDLEDDFGMMSLNSGPSMHQQQQHRQRQLQFDQRSLQHHHQQMLMQPRRPMQAQSTANAPGGLKISYVDSLPLARTNPAPKATSKSKESKKKSGLAKLKKKDNCVVS